MTLCRKLGFLYMKCKFIESQTLISFSWLSQNSLSFDIDLSIECSIVLNKFESSTYNMNLNAWLDCWMSFMQITNDNALIYGSEMEESQDCFG